jgi:hypothetical protein
MKWRWFVPMMVVLGVLCLIAWPAVAQENAFSDTFDDPLLPGWEHSPDVAVVDGALRIAPGNFAARPGGWGEITLNARMQYSGMGELLLHYSWREGSHYGLFFIGNELVLERFSDETPQPLGNTSLEAFPPDRWFDLQITISGGEHTISLDGQPVITASDPEPLPPGGIALTAGGDRTGSFDTITISAAAPAPPAEEGAPNAQPAEALPAAAPVQQPTATPQAGGGGGFLQSLFDIQTTQLDVSAFLINLSLAAIMSFILSRVYIHWGASLSNRRQFAANFMLITITTTSIILIVRSSVALSLGLVGALSIVRFRAAIKEPEELAYLFFAIGIGIGLGDNQRLISALTLAAGIVLVGVMRLFRRSGVDANLHLTVASHNPKKVDLEAITSALHPHCTRIKLVRLDETETVLEAAFLAEFRNLDQMRGARAALLGLSEHMQITFLDTAGLA